MAQNRKIDSAFCTLCVLYSAQKQHGIGCWHLKLFLRQTAGTNTVVYTCFLIIQRYEKGSAYLNNSSPFYRTVFVPNNTILPEYPWFFAQCAKK